MEGGVGGCGQVLRLESRDVGREDGVEEVEAEEEFVD